MYINKSPLRSKDKGIKRRRKHRTVYCYLMASGHMVKLMLHCALAAYINPLAVALKDLWSDCKNT